MNYEIFSIRFLFASLVLQQFFFVLKIYFAVCPIDGVLTIYISFGNIYSGHWWGLLVWLALQE